MTKSSHHENDKPILTELDIQKLRLDRVNLVDYLERCRNRIMNISNDMAEAITKNNLALQELLDLNTILVKWVDDNKEKIQRDI